MVDYKIRAIKAREILDSRGNPTIEVDIYTKSGMATAKVPSGASTGVHEALELRDGDKKKYNGKGVLKAVHNVNTILSKKLKGMDIRKPREIDNLMIELDGTNHKSHLGANAILGVSLAAVRLLAQLNNRPLYSLLGNSKLLPIPFLNVINGGAHAGNKLAIQEFMIAPFGRDFRDSLRIGAETYHELKNQIQKKYGRESTNVGDEGGFAPKIEYIEEAFKLLEKSVKELGYEKEIKFAIDAAASEFYHQGYYHVDKYKLGNYGMIEFYNHLVENYPLISIEDPFDQDHFLPWKELTSRLKNMQIVGDDLLCTNLRRIKMALDRKLCNALLLKVNQIGTVTEAVDAGRFAMKNEWKVMVSHRSGETEDSFIADLAVGLGAGQIKSGAPCRSERLAKYNSLLRIEEELGRKAKYAGKILKFRK